MNTTTDTLQYLPWNWTVKSSNPSAHCPPASSILGTFAIVNILVSLIGLVFGNRVVTNKITCGLFGKPGGSAWQYMWILTLVLQFSSNILVATIIKHTPGYGDDFSIRQLMLFFIARPRLSWMFLSMVAGLERKMKEMRNDPKPRTSARLRTGRRQGRREHSEGISMNEFEPFDNSKDAIRTNERDLSPAPLSDSEPQPFTHGNKHSHIHSTHSLDLASLPVVDLTERPWESSFLSQLIAEIILQLINLSTTGRIAVFAAKHGFYNLSNSHYHTLPRGAHLMYAGGLLYTITLPPFLIMNLLVWFFILRRSRSRSRPNDDRLSRGTIIVMQSLVVVLAVSTWLASWLIWSGYVLIMGDL
jgi:hypothetical protein